MTQYVPIKLTHAFLKEPDQKTPRFVTIIYGSISGFHRGQASDPSKVVVECTHIYTTGGIFPVVETEEQVDNIIKTAHNSCITNKGV